MTEQYAEPQEPVESRDEQNRHVGEILRQARLSLGLDEHDIATELRLSVQTVKDIENHDFRQIHALTYVKGYLRGYARMVKLPADQVLDEFANSEWAQQQLGHQPRHASTNFVAAPTVRKRKQYHHVSRWIGLGLVVVLLGLVALWWHGQKNQSQLMIHNKPLLALPEQHLPVKAESSTKG